MGLDREGPCRGLHIEAAAHASELSRKRPTALRGDVLDHAVAVDKVELAIGKGQACSGVGPHKRARVLGVLRHVNAGDVQRGLQCSQSQAATAHVHDLCAWLDAGEGEEALVPARPRARGNGGGQAGEGAARGDVDAGIGLRGIGLSHTGQVMHRAAKTPISHAPRRPFPRFDLPVPTIRLPSYNHPMSSKRQIHVGAVPIGGGAPVAVQTMTKTETANLAATMDQIHKVAEAGADIVRVAVPREQDAEALKSIVAQSPIPIIADIHFNHTLALKAIEAGAHCVRLNPGNIGGPEKVAEVTALARQRQVPLRVGVNSGSLPKHLRQLEYDNPVEALVTAAIETVRLMESLDFEDFKVSMKSTSVPNTIAANRLLAERIPYPLHLGVTEAGTKWSGSLKSAVGLGTLLADGIGDTIRISLSTFHAEEEVKVAWEILKALKLRERGPDLIACPTCGRLQFDMDTVVAEVERRLEAYEDPIEVSVLGCAVNGIGEARHADFGITGAKDMGMIYSKGEPLKKVPTEQLVDELFKEIDRYYAAGKTVLRDESKAAEARAWLAANEDATAMTPERMAALEAAAAHNDEQADAVLESMLTPAAAPVALDEAASPVAGRRFSRS